MLRNEHTKIWMQEKLSSSLAQKLADKDTGVCDDDHSGSGRRSGRHNLQRRRRATPALLHPHLGTSQAVSLARTHIDRTVVGRATIDRAMRTSTPAALDGTAAKERRG